MSLCFNKKMFYLYYSKGFDCIKSRDELYKECCAALQGGILLSGKRFNEIREALQEAFQKVDKKLLDQ